MDFFFFAVLMYLNDRIMMARFKSVLKQNPDGELLEFFDHKLLSLVLV